MGRKLKCMRLIETWIDDQIKDICDNDEERMN